MKRLLTVSALLSASSVIAMQGAAQDDAEMIKSAETAAPAAVSSGATIYAMDDKGAMGTLREGTNGWWCMPDGPVSPGIDPMCGDANTMEWLMAWSRRRSRRRGRSASPTCWRAVRTKQYRSLCDGAPPGDEWMSTGPHVMVVNAPEMMQGYPMDAKPDTTMPFVMYPGTPYAHLMIPVE